MFDILDVVEPKRECGWRKPGGLYLRCEDEFHQCLRLPIELSVCPHCGAGYRPSRAPRWFDPMALIKAAPPCDLEQDGPPSGVFPRNICEKNDCWLRRDQPYNFGRSLLIWIGEKFYRHPDVFFHEALCLGVSRRIPAFPRGFEIGSTWVFAAHHKAIEVPPDPNNPNGKPTFKSGIISILRPERIEYVVKGDETHEHLQRLADRGITLVRVSRPQMELEECLSAVK